MAMRHPRLDSLSNAACADADHCHENELMHKCASKALRRLRACLFLFCFAGMAGQVHPAESTRQDLVRDNRVLEIHISTQFSENMRQNLVEWLNFIATALQQVYGHWPRQRWQISVAPTSAGSADPIPWAQVHRGEPDRVEFFTAARASVAELKRAWTSYHELAHLLIPYRGYGDAWFSEGLASYYQNILQARSGVITEQQMWQKLYDGYQRGLADTAFDGVALQEASKRMRQQGGFMRVYWSGAWYFLAADARLRQQSGGKYTLDMALEKLNACCADQQLSVVEIVSRLDQLNRVILFQGLYEELVTSTSIPPYEPIYASLGIALDKGKVVLQSSGPGARLRQQIASGKNL